MEAKAKLATGINWLSLGTRVLPLFLLALIPKCPLCLAGYLGLLTMLGLGTVAASKWTKGALVLIGAFILFKVLRNAIDSGRQASFWMAFIGFGMILAAGFLLDSSPIRWMGFAVFSAGCAFDFTVCASRRKTCRRDIISNEPQKSIHT
jgi:hypothetical protein